MQIRRIIFLLSSSSILFLNALNAQKINGVLKLNPHNPRYFTDNSGKSIYLTGSHTWANFQEAGLPEDSLFNWNNYLKMMKESNHNFMKFWVWEQAKLGSWFRKPIQFSPLPYKTIQVEGTEKYDLNTWNQSYFDRMRKRILEAQQSDIYVSIMLFQGWSQQKEQIDTGNPWLFHPFNPKNNINQVGLQIVDSKEDNASTGTLHSLKNGDVLRFQEAYVKKVIETVNDLDNVLYEIINEGGTKEWQYHIINYIKKVEKKLPKQHPVGMSHAVVVKPLMWNQDLYDGPADWVAPSPEPFEWNYPKSKKTTDYQDKLKVNNTKKVTILDTDHLWGCGGNYAWVWKAFLQGYCPIFMDPWQRFPHVDTVSIEWLSTCTYDRDYMPYVLIRKNLGVTKHYSELINLSKSVPSPDLASSGLCLANANYSYLSYTASGEYLTINLRNTDGVFEVEWYNPETYETIKMPNVIGGDFFVFKPPFTTDAVIFIHKINK